MPKPIRSVLLGAVSLCCLALLIAPAAMAQYPADDGYERVFNGRDLAGWEIQWPGLWTVENGILIGKQDPETGGDSWLFTEREWDDFSLELEFRMTPSANSGVGIRMPAGVEGRPSQHGYEIQISDIDTQYPTGSVFRHVAAPSGIERVGEWNQLAIICVGDHIVVYLNRQKVIDARLEGSLEGRVGLQAHGGERFAEQVSQFRNIRVKDLKPQFDAPPSPIEFRVHSLDTLNSEGVSVADFDGDGLLDISSGPRWYKAPDWTPIEYRHVTADAEFMQNYGEIVMDVNKDGWPDVISGSWFEPYLFWFENPGPDGHDGTHWTRHAISDSLPATEAIIAADVDGDGHLDVLINRYDASQPITYFAYVGLENSESGFEHRVVGYHGGGHGMGFGDIDGDGRGDILTPRGWYRAPEDPATQAWTWHPEYRVQQVGVPMATMDINNDGMMDIVYGQAHNFGLYWLEQTRDSAGRRAWIYQTIDETFSQSHGIWLADMDNDGEMEILTGKRYRGHAGTDPGANEPLALFMYKVDRGPAPEFTKYIISYDENIGTGMQLTPVDIDGDGDLDLIAPGKSGLYLLENLSR